MKTGLKAIERKLDSLPNSPGVYIMRNPKGEVIYVGKASSLRNRVRSYFQPASLSRPPTRPIERFIHQVADLEYIVTRNEIEALMLESNLVRRYQPPYNVRLRDDKRYPFVKITLSDHFPGIYVTRDTGEEGTRYFGPFINTAVARQIVKELTRIFPLRTCDRSLKPSGNRMKACLNYHIGRCSAPCADKIAPGEYRDLVKSACTLLSGGKGRLIEELEREMREAAEELKFERAAKLRDRIEAVREMVDHQSIISPSVDDEDVLGIASEGDEACVQVLMVRDGKLIEREHFFLWGAEGASHAEMIAAFLKQFYSESSYVPGHLVLQEKPDEEEVLAEWLSQLRGGRVLIHVPNQGRRARLVEIARKNAELLLRERRRNITASATENPALMRLKEVLNLPTPPVRIDGFDISNIGTDYAVGSMVVFENGEPAKSWYRRFKIKTVEGQDDYAMMHEVTMRHYRKAVKGEEPIPDLILIDGGKGQLNAALETLKELELEVPIISLAKEFEHIFLPGKPDPIALDRNDPGLMLLQRIRDEAHRFALSYHRKLRSRPLSFSMLDKIPGIGPKRKRRLIRYFGSLDRIREASVEEIASLDGMNRTVAERIKRFLEELEGRSG